MERNPFLKRWFCWARNLHDIHHRVLNDSGLMDKNFGTGFAFFDWMFGTMTSVEPPFNDAGLVAANKRFQFVLEPETNEETHDELVRNPCRQDQVCFKSKLRCSDHHFIDY